MHPKILFSEMRALLEKKETPKQATEHLRISLNLLSKDYPDKKAYNEALKECLLHSDRYHGTLFHLACEFSDYRLFHALITAYGDPIPLTLREDLLAKRDRYPFPKIQEALSGLKEKQVYHELNLEQKITLMGAHGSPAKSVAVAQNQVSFSTPSGRLRRLSFNSDGEAFTPSGRKVVPVCLIHVLEDDAQSGSVMGVFTEPKKDYGVRAVPKIKRSFKRNVAKQGIKENIPPRLPANKKKSLSFVINKRVLERWKKYPLRYRSQDATMGGNKVRTIARLAGFKAKPRAFHWCHLASYSMGGPDGIKPRLKSEYNSLGPQQPNNLVLGTREANAQMLVFEHVAKALIEEGIVDQLEITVKTDFRRPLLKALHVPESLKYNICHKGFGVSLDFDMLSLRKLTPEEIEYTVKAVRHLFIEHSNKKKILHFKANLPDALFYPPVLPISSLCADPSLESITRPLLLSKRFELVDLGTTKRLLTFSDLEEKPVAHSRSSKRRKTI